MLTEHPIHTPNFGSRKGKPIRLIVLHCDASPSESATRSWIQSPASKVSYHLEVERDGTVIRYVPDSMRAWAVGVGVWNGVTDLNSISLSASFANRNDKKEALTPIQITTMQEIVRVWRAKYPTIEAVTTHAEVARPVGRKTDPIWARNFQLSDYP
jgi:N-acetyl-anhydromuramyl-L-alanine amidase AmpD